MTPALPKLLPMTKPFRHAADFQRERVPMTKKQSDTLSNEAKQRGFWIAGVTRKAAIVEAYRLASEAIEKGLTKGEFLESLGPILDREGALLDVNRLELIAQNNTAASYCAGRFKQMSDPEVTAARPYRQYPLGPHDDHTSEICLVLEGFIARWDDPVWSTITPPNHHKERHLQVTTLTEEQALASGKEIYSSPPGRLYPNIEGQEWHPDPGFDFSPGLLHADDRFLVEAANAAGELLPAKSPADYTGLLAFSDVAASDMAAAPKIHIEAIGDIHDAAQYEAARAAFREELGYTDPEAGVLVFDPQRDANRVNDRTFEHMLGITGDDAEKKLKRDRPRFFSFIRPTIEDPFEVWWTVREGPAGTPKFSKRFFGLYRGGEAFAMFFDFSAEGWLMESGYVTSPKKLERLRQGLLLSSKARKR